MSNLRISIDGRRYTSQYWLARICENCKASFRFRRCYANRPGKPGRFCSIKCRLECMSGINNPNISDLARAVGSKKAKFYKHKQNYQRIRLLALQLLSGNKIPQCSRCECDVFNILEVNHLNGVKRDSKNRYGVGLWRMVIKLKDEAKKYFNVLCKVCNQLDYIERQFGVKGHTIVWKKS